MSDTLVTDGGGLLRASGPHILPADADRIPMTAAKAVFSAVLFAIALPNEVFARGLWPLGFIAIVPFYSALASCSGFGAAAIAGTLFGGFHHALTSYWLFFYKDFALWTIGATTLGYMLVYTLPALYLRLFLRSGGAFRPLLFALAWASLEFGKSIGFLGYPWGLVPYALGDLPVLLQVADTTGVYGLSALLALCSALAAEAISGSGTMHFRFPFPGRVIRVPGRVTRVGVSSGVVDLLGYGIFVAILLAMATGYGIMRLSKPSTLAGSVRMLLVQQNIDPWYAGEEAALAISVRLAREALGAAAFASAGTRPGTDPAGQETMRWPELIVFSETSLRRPFPENPRFYATHPVDDPLVPMLRETGTWLLTGAPYLVGESGMMNAVILVDPSGTLVEHYGKMHPVPFTEAIPFMEYEWFREFMRNAVGLESGWVTGDRRVIFELPAETGTIRFAAPVCFEDAFAGMCADFIRDGADLLVNLTNDSWSQTESAMIQHWTAARFRAIETRRTLVRSTNGGLSCVIGPKGETIFEMPLFQAMSAIVDVPVYREAELTFYTRYGDWFALLCVLLSGFSTVVLGRGERRRR